MSYKSVVIIAVFLFAYASGAPVWADETGKEHVHEDSDQHKENVERLLELMGVPAQVDNAAGEVLKIYSAKITDDKASDEFKKLVSAYQTDLQKMVAAVLSWEAIKPNYINIYARHLSPADVAGATQFIQSPAGQTFFAGQAAAGEEIQRVTKHLIQADLAEPLKQLSKLLREGLVKVRAAQDPN